jgi:hypothetical protein
MLQVLYLIFLEVLCNIGSSLRNYNNLGSLPALIFYNVLIFRFFQIIRQEDIYETIRSLKIMDIKLKVMFQKCYHYPQYSRISQSF